MAVKIKNFPLLNGLVVPEAYIRIDAFFGSKSGITYSANTYMSEEAFKGGAATSAQPYLEQQLLELVPDSTPGAPPIWEQLYGHLSSQERYQASTIA